MKKIIVPHALACGFFVVCALAIPAHAVVPSQTFVSATGSDSNPCTQAQPCATFQAAINAVAPGGEVDALTAGNFENAEGTVINHSVTIDGKGLASLNSPSGQAIAVNAATTDQVVLRGHVTISGATSYGVEDLNSPGTITITDSTINGGAYGVDIQSSAFYGASAATVSIERTTITGTTTDAVYVGVGATSVDSSTFLNNNTALEANGLGLLRLSNNNIYNNKSGVVCSGAPAGVIDSQGNNRKGSNAGGATACTTIGVVNLQ